MKMSACKLPGVGVFGNSPAACLLAKSLQEKGFKVEAVWGRTDKEAEETSKSLRVNFYTSKIDDVLLRKDVDFVIIFCPPSLHSQIAVKALGIGKHVLCGVPGGLDQAEGLRMVQAAQYYPNLMATVGYGLRFLPAVVALRRQIHETNFLGESISLVDVRIECGSLLEKSYSWCCDSGMGGGVLSLLGSHIIDLLQYLNLGRVVRVNATLKTLTTTTDNIRGIRQITADDVAVLQLQLVGGVYVTATINSEMEGFSQKIIVCGTAGRLVLCGGDLRGRRKGAVKDEVLHVDTSSAGNLNEDPSLPTVHREGLVRMVAELKEIFSSNTGFEGERVSGGQQWGQDHNCIATTFDEALYVQAVIEALRKSSNSRQWTKVFVCAEDGSSTDSSM